ncbi:MAG: TetR/AcrR family transcriptional regulator, partial [Candidatus Avispirillum sp.]
MSRQHQQERSEAVKQMILEAALEIELEDGEDKVTVRRIGEKIGYSTGVIYYHFRDKQDIIDELSRKIDTEAYETVKAFIDPAKSIRENLKCLYIG